MKNLAPRSVHRRSQPGRDSKRAGGIRLRPAKPGESEILGEAGWRAFRAGSPELWGQFFGDSHELVPDDTLIAEVGDAIAGHATALRLTMSLAGKDVSVRGLAGVAVVPEFRRRGVADRLMQEWLGRLRRRGEALSLLYPFRMSFYRKFGYGTVEWTDHVRVRPAQLPVSKLRRQVRRFDRERDEAAVRSVYEASRAGTSGPLRRHDVWWRERVFKRVPEGVVYVAPKDGAIAGYLLYEIPAEPPYPRQHCLIKEIVGLTPDAWAGLLGYLEALGDQFAMIELALPRGHAVPLLTDFGLVEGPSPLRLFQIGSVQGTGAMARLVDLPAAFAIHPGPQRNGAQGRIGLDVDDSVFDSEPQSFDLTLGPEGASLEKGRSARPRLRLSVDRLAQVYWSAVSAAVLLDHGQMAGSRRAAVLLDDAFRGPQPFLYPLNGF